MTFSLSVKADIKDVTRYLTRLEKKQIPFATARALTKTAKEVQKAIKNEMRQAFDRPTSFTLNSTYIVSAKSGTGRAWVSGIGTSDMFGQIIKRPSGYAARFMEAEIGIKDESAKSVPPIKWLNSQIYGGRRKHKRVEMRLISRGIMKASEYAVPGQRAKLNKFGNMTRGVIMKILSDVHAQYDPRNNTTKYKNKHYYFAEINGQRGIWYGALSGGSSWPILMFVRKPRYRKRLRFHKVADRIASRRFLPNFRRSLSHALRTAR